MKKTYKDLGGEIKNLRLISGESQAEVSDAVEIQENLLKQIEKGEVRPDEDIMALLLSHFEVEGDKALRLWTLAGYDYEESEAEVSKEDSNDGDKNEIRINIPADNPVLYTDMVQVMSNQYGIVLHFLQLQPNKQANVVSRIGMSKEHAESLYELLKRNLDK